MSHVRGSRHQKLKHHIRQRVRNLHRVATLAATVTAAAAPSGGARADTPRTAPAKSSFAVNPSNAAVRPARATMPPLESSTPATASSTPNAASAPNAASTAPSEAAPASPPKVKATAKSKAKPHTKTLPIAKRLPQLSTASSAALASNIAKSNLLAEAQALEVDSLSLRLTRPDGVLAARQPLLAQADTTPATVLSAPPKTVSPAAVNTTAEKPKTDDRVLLAQLDAELQATETKLKNTDEKLSDGQRDLMRLSNTLRSVMLEDGDNASGLHPFVRVASRYAGTPYVWGGESRYGFDCSGFIIRVMRDLGYKALPHSAAEQFKYGIPVAQALLKPGDLVFFANTYKPGISHVGIYIGKRRFIHAASTRQGTIVSSLDSVPYSRKYAGARRLVSKSKA